MKHQEVLTASITRCVINLKRWFCSNEGAEFLNVFYFATSCSDESRKQSGAVEKTLRLPSVTDPSKEHVFGKLQVVACFKFKDIKLAEC